MVYRSAVESLRSKAASGLDEALHALLVGLGEHGGAAQVALPLLRLLGQDVAVERVSTLHPPLGGGLEALRGAPVRLHLRHGTSPLLVLPWPATGADFRRVASPWAPAPSPCCAPRAAGSAPPCSRPAAWRTRGPALGARTRGAPSAVRGTSS